MKTMQNNKMISMLLSLVLIVSTTGLLQAQQSESLKRDMEVTANLLSTLLKTNSGNSFMRVGADGIETSYNEGFGVVFNLKGNSIVLRSAQAILTDEPRRNSGDIEVDLEIEDANRRLTGVATSPSRNQNVVFSSTGRVQGVSSWSTGNEFQGEKNEDSIKEFLIEYGSFLKDLKPEERIMVQFPFFEMRQSNDSIRGGAISLFNFYSRTNNSATKSFSILKKDADAYRSGSITKEQALSRIEIEENLPEEIATDLRVLGELMNSLYSERSSKSYFSTSNPSIVKTKGMGAIYSWAVYSGYNDNFGYRLPTLVRGEQSVDEKNRNEIVKAAYPTFLESFKENLVDYGRTIKSLDTNEKIVFNIKMTRCDGCGIPEVLKVEMDKGTIEEYNQGKISRSQAIARLKVSEN
jgi:hypothetical protein